MNNIDLFRKIAFINNTFVKKNANQKSISQGQGMILLILKRHDGISTKQLAEMLNIKITSLNETLNKLIKKDYIEKKPSTEDKRILLIYLTKKGHEFKPPMPKDLDIFDCLTSSEKEELDKYLTLICHEFHNRLKQEDPEKFEKMHKQRKEFLKKYCGDDEYFKPF